MQEISSQAIFREVAQTAARLARDRPLGQIHAHGTTQLERGFHEQQLTSSKANSYQVYWNLAYIHNRKIQIPVRISNHSFMVVSQIPETQGIASFDVHAMGRLKLIDAPCEDSDFGRWNQIIAVDEEGRLLDKFYGHAGELYPGKLDDHVEALRRRVVEQEVWPVQVDLDISNVCSSRCQWCFSAAYREQAWHYTSTELLFKLIREIAEGGTKVLRFDGGGDPLAHPHIAELVQFAHHHGLTTAVLTAGELLKDKHIQVFLECNTYVRISFNAASNITRLKIHRPSNEKYNLDYLLDKVGAFARLRDEKRSALGKQAGRHIGGTFLIDNVNYSEIFDAAYLLKEVGLDHISFRRVLGHSHAIPFTEGQKEEIHRQFNRILHELADDDFIVFVPWRDLTDEGLIPSQHFTECLACNHRTVIDVDKDANQASIELCGRYRGFGTYDDHSRESDLVLGRYNESVSFSEIWLSPHMKQVISQVPSICGDCIDRGANILFGNIQRILQQHPQARFFKCHDEDSHPLN